jgi:hypothetical protein
MTTTPTRSQRRADATCAELDQLAVILGGPKALAVPTYTALRRSVHAVISRDGEPATIDGYKSKHGDTSGARGGPASVPTGDPNEPGYVALDGPLAMVLKRPDIDVVHRAALRLEHNVRQMRDLGVGIDNAIRTVPTPGQATPTAALCSCCRQEPGDRETDINGALPGARFLCLTCIAFVEKQGTAGIGSNRRGWAPRLPNDAELEARRTGKPARVRVNPKEPFHWSDGSTTGITPTPPTAA